jgi:hypothetical protein
MDKSKKAREIRVKIIKEDYKILKEINHGSKKITLKQNN